MNDEIEVKNGDFMTPEEAQKKLGSLGYNESIFVPKGSHYLTALYNIANSGNGGSLTKEVDSLHATDPRHQSQLRNFYKIPPAHGNTNRLPTIYSAMKELKNSSK